MSLPIKYITTLHSPHN